MFCIFCLVFVLSHSIDNCIIALKYIENMRAVLANQIADILDFNNNSQNVMRLRVVDNRFVV